MNYVFQIFYDEASRAALDPGFIPLDNSTNERPDWFEFWPIRRFLTEVQLDEGAFYGFFSPKFRLKTRIGSADVLAFVEHIGPSVDVALFSPAWDQTAYFLNPFEQGEFWHPGLLELSQSFLARTKYNIDLRQLVTHSTSSSLCSYIVGKPSFWREWLQLASQLFELVEHGTDSLAERIRAWTTYGAKTYQAPMKIFILERLASVILARKAHRVASIDLSYKFPPWDRLFPTDHRTCRMLQTCDFLKHQYVATGDSDYIRMYAKVRASVKIMQPPPDIHST